MNFIPYGKQSISQDDISGIVDALNSDYLTTGPKVEEFEQALCRYTKAKYCVAVCNGTAALHLTSLAILQEGDKVVTTPNSFLATSNSILYARAIPVFVDIKENGNIDLDLCEEKLKKDPSIKAIYAVAFSGRMVDQKLKYLKDTYNIKIVEDCAHAIGAKDGVIKAGSCVSSDISIFSFHPVKHITTGEGGAITTNDKEIYQQLKILRNHGMVKTQDMKPWEYEMQTLGFNYRITDIQCALGLSQLKKQDSFVNKRVKLAKNYDKAFLNSIVKPLYLYDGLSSYHLYVVRVDFTKLNISKEQLFIKMRESNIGLQVHYIPINKQPYYKSFGYGDELTPVMDRYYKECFSLPLYPALKDKEQQYVINKLLEYLK